MKLEKFFEMKNRPNLQLDLEAQFCLLDFHQKHSCIIIIVLEIFEKFLEE